MKQIIRYAIVVLVLVSLVFLARNNASGAGVPGDKDAPAILGEAQPAAQADQGGPGTVKPPPSEILITASGTYSIGGFCAYTVEFLQPGITVRVALERPLPRPLPDGVHKVRQGCRVTYYQDGIQIEEFTSALGTSKICFAATPKETNQIHFYNVYDTDPVWSPTPETELDGGIMCSAAGPSAVYVGTFKTP